MCKYNPKPGGECIHFRADFDGHCDNPNAQHEAREEARVSPSQKAPVLDQEVLDEIDESQIDA